MSVITEGNLLWEPSAAVKERANLTHYMDWLGDERGLTFGSYPELWQWSVTDLEAFWASIWDYFDVIASNGYAGVLEERKEPPCGTFFACLEWLFWHLH